MSYKELVVSALKDHRIKTIDSPLGNEFILDDEWLVEMDRDGAFAVTVSHYPKITGSYQDTHRIVVFQEHQDDYIDRLYTEIRKKLMKAINSLKVY